MCKYSKTITLETIDSYHPIKFTTMECDTPEDCDKELLSWLTQYPELTKNQNNKKIIAWCILGK